MRINDKQFITDTDKTGAASDSKKAGAKRASGGKQDASGSLSISSSDTLQLSSRSKEIAEIALQLKQSSEVREELVSELREKIQSGTYQIQGKDIAAKILDKANHNIF